MPEEWPQFCGHPIIVPNEKRPTQVRFQNSCHFSWLQVPTRILWGSRRKTRIAERGGGGTKARGHPHTGTTCAGCRPLRSSVWSGTSSGGDPRCPRPTRATHQPHSPYTRVLVTPPEPSVPRPGSAPHTQPSPKLPVRSSAWQLPSRRQVAPACPAPGPPKQSSGLGGAPGPWDF
jgi:hypothetical protein